jgi:hypothetical protein
VTKITNSVFWMPLAVVYKLYADVEDWPLELDAELVVNGGSASDVHLRVCRCVAAPCLLGRPC